MPQDPQQQQQQQQKSGGKGPAGGDVGLDSKPTTGSQGVDASGPSSGPGDLATALGPNLLRKGVRGKAIEALQTLLNKGGAGLEVDGVFGEKTHMAVLVFQDERDILVDGVVGAQTKQALAGGGKSGPKKGGTQEQKKDPPGEKPGDRTQKGEQGDGKEPPWVGVARGEKGVKEIPGRRANPRVIEYHATTGKWGSDEVPWCSSFVNWCMEQAGYRGTGSATALSWKNWGKKVSKPALGAIAVFSWGGGKGHVGFIIGKSGSSISVLGGNQSDQVKVSTFGTGCIVAYVVPANYEVPPSAYVLGATGKSEKGGLGNTR